MKQFPRKVVCLTEESVETLYLLGRQESIAAVSKYVMRPAEARSLPKVTSFIKSNYDKIAEIDPDLIIGFSDIQKDIARDLVERGYNVFIANQRNVVEILDYIQWLGNLFDAAHEAKVLVDKLQGIIASTSAKGSAMINKPRVYFEEWYDPMITGIGWVSDCIEISGGIDINREKSQGTLAKDRFVSSEEIIKKNPDVIFVCWCGKPADIKRITARPGWQEIKAIKHGQIYELPPEIFLQPGPAPVLDGLGIMQKYLTGVAGIL